MMKLANRFPENPLLTPQGLTPSDPQLTVECVLNPGVFRFQGKVYLLVRVAERPQRVPGRVRIPVREDGRLEILEVDAADPDLDTSDPREFKYQGERFLSVMSHLRLFSSDDGISFTDTGTSLFGEGPHEAFDIEDCRVSHMNDGRFVLAYTAVSKNGYGVGMRTTRDWQTFQHFGMVIPPANKDCAIFEERIDGKYMCLHRPSGVIVGGHYIWISDSPDLEHWGNHRCIARTRPGAWDGRRVGCGTVPFKTDRGWLEIYHGCDEEQRYCLGAMLLDLNDPSRVLARSEEPIMEPTDDYEKEGFFGQVVFANGHLVDGGELTLYYGASDSVICGARFSIPDILKSLQR